MSQTRNAVKLSWSKPELVQGREITVNAYEVRYSYGAVNKRVIITSQSYTLSGLKPNTSVKFEVIALYSFAKTGNGTRKILLSGEKSLQ